MIPRLFRPEDGPPDDAPHTVADVIALYLRHCAVEAVHCPEARAQREHILGLFVADHGDLLVAQCRPHHLTDWIESHPSWKSVSTRRAKACMVSAAFRWAANGERIARNPFHAVRYGDAERRPDLPDETLDQVLQHANKRYERAVRFLRLTACRLTELCEAEWPNVDLDRGIWIIHRHKSRKRTGKPKVVALVAEAVALLRAIQSENTEPAGFVFINNRGRPWTRSSLGQCLRYMKRAHGIKTPASLHGIRHRWGSCAVANGAPIKLVSAQMGHSTTTVTEKYYVDLTGEIEAIRAAAELGQRKPGKPHS